MGLKLARRDFIKNAFEQKGFSSNQILNYMCDRDNWDTFVTDKIDGEIKAYWYWKGDIIPPFEIIKHLQKGECK